MLNSLRIRKCVFLNVNLSSTTLGSKYINILSSSSSKNLNKDRSSGSSTAGEGDAQDKSQGQGGQGDMKSSTDNIFKSIIYSKVDRIAHITLNRPKTLNAIDTHMPAELEQAVSRANNDENVRVILLSGNGKAFCSGYDLKLFAEGERGKMIGSQRMPWDPYIDYKFMSRCTEAYMSLWKSFKPVICKVHGYAVAGGSDIALCSDIIVMSEDALIGYPPSRVWGCPSTAMWVYRVGPERAKRLLFTGELITGKEAARIGLVGEAVPADMLNENVDNLIKKISSVPTNQLFMQKQVINHAVEQMGLFQTQRLATIFDGMTRHSPEGVAFQKRVSEVGFKQAVFERDSY